MRNIGAERKRKPGRITEQRIAGLSYELSADLQNLFE